MLPFIIGDAASIPEEYRHYHPLVQRCGAGREEHGRVGYLSVSEGHVRAGTTQRRPGIHTEKQPGVGWGGGSWGGGVPVPGALATSGGLYMASSVGGSCRVWPVHLETTGPLGDCEALRPRLGRGTTLRANELVWLTDGCPHEALPAAVDGYRQWFRFVTHDVGAWFAADSTANRLGVVPPCRVITTSKFA